MVANTVFATAPVALAPAEPIRIEPAHTEPGRTRQSAARHTADGLLDAGRLDLGTGELREISVIESLAAIIGAVTDGIQAEVPVRPVVSAAIRHRIPAGWYRDRENPTRRRWWDGTDWTDHYTPLSVPVTAPRPPRHLAVTAEIPAAAASRAPVPRIVIVLLSVVSAANAVALSLLAVAH